MATMMKAIITLEYLFLLLAISIDVPVSPGGVKCKEV
jgi:hypothetical protein